MERASAMTGPGRLLRTPRGIAPGALPVVRDLSDRIGAHDVEFRLALRAVGLDESTVGHGCLDLPRYCELIEAAADQTGNDAFGLQFGRNLAPEGLGLVGAIALSSSTLGAALDNLARFFPCHRQDTHAIFRRSGDLCRLEYRILDGRVLRRRQDAELTMSSLLNLIRRCLGGSWTPDEVHFEHPRPETIRVHQSVFNAPIHFSMKTNSLVFRDPGLSRPMPGRNPTRLQELSDGLVKVSSGPGTLSLTDQVAGEIRSRLPAGYPHIEDVADALRMTRWTLQRRLAEHGQVFSDLVELTRRRLAELHLGTVYMPIREIAEVLGYSELSAFTRAFTRWFGEPPSRVRERLQRAALPASSKVPRCQTEQAGAV